MEDDMENKQSISITVCNADTTIDSDKPTKRTPNADLMLGQRRRRWPNIESALGQGVVFAGSRHTTVTIYYL